MIVLFVHPKKSNRVNYQACISEDENKVARVSLNTVWTTNYSLALSMWRVSLAKGLMEMEGTLWSEWLCLDSEQCYFCKIEMSNLSTTAEQLSLHPGTDVAKTCCVSSRLFNFSIHQGITIAMQQVWCNGRSQFFQLVSHLGKRWEIMGAEINVCCTLL